MADEVNYRDDSIPARNIAGMMDIEDIIDEPSSSLNDQTNADVPTTYTDIMKDNAYIGQTPFDVIMEGIEAQFDDYINIEDNTNYVDIFYDQLHASYEAANSNNETFKDDIIEVIDNIHRTFIEKITDLFNVRLTLTIADMESESIDVDDMEFIIRRLYEFFILGARANFKAVIANDVKQRMDTPIEDHREYLKTLRTLMASYNPLITTIGPIEFLKYRGDQEIIQFFETGKVAGNFLRKYTPKLYQNMEFEVELINYITMVQQIKEEVFNNGR